jgi:hypothetical protein
MQCQTFAAQVAGIRAKGYYRNAYWSYGNAIVYGEVVAQEQVAVPECLERLGYTLVAIP